VARTARPAALLPVLLLAGCATGLRRPAVTVGLDLDGDARVDRIETIEKGRVKRVVKAPPPGSKPAGGNPVMISTKSLLNSRVPPRIRRR